MPTDLGAFDAESGPDGGEARQEAPGAYAYDHDYDTWYDDDPARDDRPATRRRPLVLMFAAAAAVAAIGIGAVLLMPDDGDTDRKSADPGPTVPTPTDEPTAATSADDATASASPSASKSSHSVSASPSATQTTSKPPPQPTSARPTRSQAPAPPPTLRMGDSGPEVVELQKRLLKTGTYPLGDTDGTFDAKVRQSVRTYQLMRGIDGDESGVYGPATRRALESET
ncbi:peptidoglycan-binding domain-containing protein [Streptomyces boninensis]|uniref:peptidoglycan-binding domain-containing protein n=1 Tax=Streptomyces boninensis TaxID=2039455 RepID=UPI003B219876